MIAESAPITDSELEDILNAPALHGVKGMELVTMKIGLRQRLIAEVRRLRFSLWVIHHDALQHATADGQQARKSLMYVAQVSGEALD